MKIIVYNYQDQYALSRKQVEAIKEILPNEYFEPIKEFHLTHTKRGAEIFEFNPDARIAYFAFPVKEKTRELVCRAITELLVGLAKIKAITRWGYPVSEQERATYQEFCDKYEQKCIIAALPKSSSDMPKGRI